MPWFYDLYCLPTLIAFGLVNDVAHPWFPPYNSHSKTVSTNVLTKVSFLLLKAPYNYVIDIPIPTLLASQLPVYKFNFYAVRTDVTCLNSSTDVSTLTTLFSSTTLLDRLLGLLILRSSSMLTPASTTPPSNATTFL